jgi:single-stranded DNA-binding protein
MGIEATGKLHTIFDTKQVSERFTKREFVLELQDNPKYPQVVLFQLTGDRCAQLDGMRVGDMVRIDFSLRGREWRSPQGETKYFNSLDVWKVEPASARREARGVRNEYDEAPRGRSGGGGGGGNYGGGGGGGGYGGGGGGGYNDAPRARSAPPTFDEAPPRDDEPRPRDEFGRGDGDDLPF